MYISQFCAFNFRSLKQVIIRLENGKNVIVGKNNSGKSNILRGIEILVGEKFPTYINFTDNDFYTHIHIDKETGEVQEIISENMYIEVVLEGRDFDEELIGTIRKQAGFCLVENSSVLFRKQGDDEIIINYDFFQNLDDLENRPEIIPCGTFGGGRLKKTEWKKPDVLIEFLKSCKRLKLFFCKSRLDDEKSGFGLLCVDQYDKIWINPYISKKLRDSLITTTVISALRSQKEDLRLVHYTWYGKLIMGLWQKNKSKIYPDHDKPVEELISEKTSDIKTFVDFVFENETSEIRRVLEGAIAHKQISFKFMNDTTSELYKNVQLFVNDGIDRPLHEKGTGIQSAIIISLFSLYCNYFHNNSSLLITEEPELFLHPQARRVISAELDKFLVSSKDQPRQLIISTHSTEYLKNVDPKNIIRVYKDPVQNCSIARQLDLDTSKELTIELKRFLWSNNTELFFADKVVLVEGGEVYLIPSIVDKVKGGKQVLDYQNITVCRVNGKGSFLNYVKMLTCFDIKYVILGDLDCFKDEVPKLIKHLALDDIKATSGKVKGALTDLPVDYETIENRLKQPDKNLDAQTVQNLFEKFAKSEIKNDDPDLLSIIAQMQARYTKGDKVDAISKSVSEEEFTTMMKTLRENNIFIWSKGDLETYYSPKAKEITAGKSKDIKALELSYLLNVETQKIEELFLNTEEISSLVDIILAKPEPLEN